MDGASLRRTWSPRPEQRYGGGVAGGRARVLEAAEVVETKRHTDSGAPLDFCREREAAAYAEYLDGSCDLWLMQGADHASGVCAQVGR